MRNTLSQYDFDQICAEAAVYIGGPAVESYLTPIVAILGWPFETR
jgi:hypothetical protein